MTNYAFNNDDESIKYVINRLSENKNLNDWEKSFIESVKEYYIDKHGFLSDKQMQKLSDLWEKY